MGAQLAKPRVKANRKVKSVRTRLQRLRQNKTAPLFTTTSTVSLDKCDSLSDIPGYQFEWPNAFEPYNRTARVDERPEYLIDLYKDLKNKVHAFDGCGLSWHELKQALEDFAQSVGECDAQDLRGMLLAKARRLDAMLGEKRCADASGGSGDDGCELVDSGSGEMDASLEEDLSDIDMRQVQTFDTFLVLSARLDALRYRMIEYYGDNAHPEFSAILDDLQEILLDVREIKDGGIVRVIVTREEYEDYADALQKRFLKLVEINMRQKKTSIFTGGTARSVRIRRSNSTIAV